MKKELENLTIEEYKELNILKEDDDILKFIYGYSDEELNLMDVLDYSLLLNDIKDYNNYVTRRFNYIQLGNYKLYYKSYKKLTLGEYLDIYNYIKTNDIHKIYAIFYRLEVAKKTIFDERVLEDYTFDIEYRQNIFNKISIKFYFQILDDIYTMGQLIKKNYKLIFEEEEKNIDISELEGAEQQEYLHNKKIKESYNNNAWEYIVYHLSNNDITNLNDVYSINIFTIFNTLLLRRKLELHNK